MKQHDSHFGRHSLFKAGKVKNDCDKYLSHRARLQRNGSCNAKSQAEKGDTSNTSTTMPARQSWKKPYKAAKDFTHFCERIKAGHKVRARLHQWPFRELQQMIVDKASRLGMRVMFVDPRYTSKTCSACGAIGKRKKHRFECHCGYRAHSDLNAGRNLHGLGYLLMTRGPDVNRPNATLRM